MNKTLIKSKLDSCNCLCHEHCIPEHVVQECVNINKSQIIPEPIDRNMNNQLSFNYSYDSPLYINKNKKEEEKQTGGNYTYSRQSLLFNEVKKEIEKNDINSNRKYDIRERAQVIKEKIDNIFLLKKMNNANRNIRKEFDIKNKMNNDNNINNNITINKFTFYEKLNMNKKGKTPFFRKKLENELNVENQNLKKMLSNIPRHEKNKSAKRQNEENMKLLFTNGIFRMKSYDAKNIMNNKNKKFNGYTSMVMPPNNLCVIGLKNNC